MPPVNTLDRPSVAVSMAWGVQSPEYHDQSLLFLEGGLPRRRNRNPNRNHVHDFYVPTQTVPIGQKLFVPTKA